MMYNFAKLLVRSCLYTCIFFVGISCKDTDDFLSPESKTQTTGKEANAFDFSTTRKVDLMVDYSQFETYGPVFFQVYNVNPIVNEGKYDEYVDESIDPIFAGYTDEYGKFDDTVVLPAYGRVLHVVTGNFLIGLNRQMVEVTNGEAKVVVENHSASRAATRAPMRIPSTSTKQTSSIEDMFNLWFVIDSNRKICGIEYKNHKGKKDDKKTDSLFVNCAYTTPGKGSYQPYKPWVTPLGTWDPKTGHPNYTLDKATADPELFFSDEEIKTMWNTVTTALNSGTTCKASYVEGADLTLIRDAEVSITALGSMTCWNSSLGYYYYTAENPPKSTRDLNIIMLFPNTQDGKRYENDNNLKDVVDYQDNIGMNRGDAIQLMYYPNIANGDLSGATKTFPMGTKIGFILKPNGWGMLSDDHCISGLSYGNRRYSSWASSTEGMSFTAVNSWQTGEFALVNPTGRSRTAKFAHVKGNDKYSIISFEDACNDKDYDDLVFAINPKNAFAELPQVEKGKTTTVGVYAFEDMWPGRGDYDMNDVMVECKHEVEFYNGKSNDPKNGLINKESYYLTTYQNYVTRANGLAVTLDPVVNPKSIVMKKITNGKTTEVSFTKEDNIYYLTDNVTDELESTYVFEITYSTPQANSNLVSLKPFIWRDEEVDGEIKRWEMHIPYEAPTKKMDWSFFGTENDASVPSEGKWFVRPGKYPFGFYLAGASAESFKETVLKRANESKPIDNFYPEFIEWSTSGGEKNADWYLHPKE